MDGASWRDIAVGLCNILNTPLPTVLKLRLDEAVQWYEACARYQNPPSEEHH